MAGTLNVLEHVDDAYLVCMTGGAVVYGNRRARDLLMPANDEPIETLAEAVEPADAFLELISEARTVGDPVPGRVRARDGGSDVRLEACRIRLGDTAAVIVRCQLASEADAPFEAINRDLRLKREMLRHRRARLLLEQSRSDLDGFAARAAHELKAPARKVSSFAGLLCDDLKDSLDEFSAELLESIRNNADRMIEVIDAVYHFSSGSAGPLELADCPLDDVLETAAGAVAMDIHRSRVRLDIGPLPIVRGTPVYLALVFQNLLENAVKFRRQDVTTQVRIRWQSESGGGGTVTVSDNGIGFDQADAARIFAPFSRLEGADVDGAGLGLSTCRSIVERHGWLITASGRPGEGAVFSIHIPREAVVSLNGL
ncbi:MAG: sensor histidine kinase [Minwuia sp.]|uniref:sensor histidine kinase n=1 Tax=Minwuia sp. TaxID=2493630 RepID=UPI003A8A909B